jgi:hypothetical protein
MRTFTILLISIFSLAAVATSTKADAQPGFSGNIDFNTFYQELSPYGQWMDVPRYGRVWSYNEPGFRPYATNGQWENTDQGWSWNSNYQWGSIPFHYGRWELDPYYGWLWIPGYDYAPAWVVWSQAGDCYGWAPLGFGLDINVSFGRIPSNRWMYASAGNITRSRIDRYCIPYERNNFYYGRQQPIINVYSQRNVRYMGGPRRDDHFQPQRPNIRSDQYNNRGDYYGNNGPYNNYNNGPRNGNNAPRRNDYSGNDRNRPDNNIHSDPADQYNRDRAIAGSRPQVNQDTRGHDREIRPQTGQEQSRPQMNQPSSPRPQISQPSPRPQMNQPRVNSQPQPQIQPQRNSGGEGSGPMGGRNRRIF